MGEAGGQHDAGAEAPRHEQRRGVPPAAQQRQRHADRGRRQDAEQAGNPQLLALCSQEKSELLFSFWDLRGI